MSWLVGQASSEWEVAAKAAPMYATALLALRVGERRTLAQWTIIDSPRRWRWARSSAGQQSPALSPI
jgi:hypothetical protein